MSLRARDMAREAILPCINHRLRTFFTLLGILVASGGLVATTSLVATGESDLRKSLDGLHSQSVQAQIGLGSTLGSVPDWQQHLLTASKTSGGKAGRITWPIAETQAFPILILGEADPEPLRLVAVSGEVVEVSTSGAPLELLDKVGSNRAIWIGHAAAARLQTRVGDSVRIGGSIWVVAGIIEQTPNDPDWLLAGIISAQSALEEFGDPGIVALEVDTDPGKAPTVAQSLPHRISPSAPGEVIVLLGPDASEIARRIDDRVVGAGIGITIASVLVGVVFIGVTSFATVLERQPELALRRALGARRKDVALVIVAESSAIGLVGGIGGAIVGSGVGVIAAVLRGTQPVLPLWVVAAAVLCGLFMGMIGGLAPAIKAVRVDPIQFLRLL